MTELYLEIYTQISNQTNKLLENYIHDEDKSYEAGMVLLMLSMKMLMFSGVTKKDLPKLYDNIEKTFNSVYKDFEIVDLNLEKDNDE